MECGKDLRRSHRFARDRVAHDQKTTYVILNKVKNPRERSERREEIPVPSTMFRTSLRLRPQNDIRRSVAGHYVPGHLEKGKTMATTNGRLKRKEYEKELRKLQVELCALQEWVKEAGARISSSLKGAMRRQGRRDQGAHRAGQPRVFRVVALPAPSDREKSQLYMQRYLHICRQRARS